MLEPSASPPPGSAASTSGRSWRSREALLLYAAFAIGAGAVTGLGAIMIPLQAEQHVDRDAISLYSALYSLGPILIGLIGTRLISRYGIGCLVLLSMCVTILGAALMWVPWRPVTLPGAFLLGFGGAIISLVMPVRLAELHPLRAPRALGEATAVASSAAVLFPIIIALALSANFGWRIGYLVPVIALALLVLAVRWRSGQDGSVSHLPVRATPEPVPLLPYLSRLADIPLAVSAEFAFVFWAASAVVEWHGSPAERATLIASLFLVGMAAGRIASGWLFDRLAPRQVVVAGCSTALAGTAAFWAGGPLWLGMVGLVLAGLGIAVLYPASMTRLIAAWPEHRNRSSQFAALALGLSVGAAPVLLAYLSTLSDMRYAFGIVPIFVAALLLKNLRDTHGDTPLARRVT